jgi:NAD(P)-dependent dehydrogenase (short-subunit alcohol dehydrogenase family)
MLCRHGTVLTRHSLVNIIDTIIVVAQHWRCSSSRVEATLRYANKQYSTVERTVRLPAPNKMVVLFFALGDFSSIREAVDILLLKNLNKIDIVINNAGVMMGTKTKSKDGYELMMQANHLGHFLWTQLLLPHLQKDARIVCVTSSTHAYAKGGFDFEDMFCDNQRTCSVTINVPTLCLDSTHKPSWPTFCIPRS